MPTISLDQAWAKTRPISGAPAVSLLTHSLRVGAVAAALVNGLPPAARRLFSDETWRGVVTLAALHDAGKLSPGYLRQSLQWLETVGVERPLAKHWLDRETDHALLGRRLIEAWLRGTDRAGYALAVGGHHGGLDHGTGGSGERFDEVADKFFASARTELFRRVETHFGPLPKETLGEGSTNEVRILVLTGLLTLADWIGSDEVFFPLSEAAGRNEEDVMTFSRTQAGHALRSLLDGWSRATPGKPGVKTPVERFGSLFQDADGHALTPNPVQRALASEIDRTPADRIQQSPGFYLVEAPDGCGKTEAALYAASLLWQRGGERGLYYAAPTRDGSGILAGRINRFLSRVFTHRDRTRAFDGDTGWLQAASGLVIHPAAPPEPSSQFRADTSTELADEARHWFASGRRALLHPFGVDTLDQILLSVLPARGAGVRLLALAGKVVILEHRHIYDPNANNLIDRLVPELLQVGASVIVLTTALPAARKARLLAAAGALAGEGNDARYPLVSSLVRPTDHDPGRQLIHARVAPSRAFRRRVRLEHLSIKDADGLWQRVWRKAAQGACVVVIRNTVGEAQETYRALRQEARANGKLAAVALLHGRFPLGRRHALEKLWLARLGPQGARTATRTRRPAGCVLVTSQIIEGADVDADLVVTDLAPTDVLLERLGLVHRHRDRTRPAGCQHPAAWLLHPPLNARYDDDAIMGALGRSANVYPPPTLFRSWAVWLGRASVGIPGEVRELMEATYPDLTNPKPLQGDDRPAGLRSMDAQFLGRFLAHDFQPMRQGRRVDVLAAADSQDGSRTRWKNYERSTILLLREPPRDRGDGSWEFHLLDGTPAFAIPRPPRELGLPYTAAGATGESVEPWNLRAAQAFHRNAITGIPRYAVPGWSAAAPDCLRPYFEGDLAVGVIEGDTVIPLKPMHLRTPPYRVGWNPREGLSITKAS